MLLLMLVSLMFVIVGAIVAAALFFGWAAIVGVLWLLVKLPIALFLFVFGLVLCCTIILIPVGIACMKGAFHVLV